MSNQFNVVVRVELEDPEDDLDMTRWSARCQIPKDSLETLPTFMKAVGVGIKNEVNSLDARKINRRGSFLYGDIED